MKTILTLDDDVLTAAKAMAARQKTTVGAVSNGVPLLPRRPDLEQVAIEFLNELRDEPDVAVQSTTPAFDRAKARQAAAGLLDASSGVRLGDVVTKDLVAAGRR